MTQVAIESSARQASIAVRVGTRSLGAQLSSERAHASDLLPLLDRLLGELDRRPDTIEALFVGTGPGSYTGLRVGIATALGLARATGAALLGVPSGDTLAFGGLAVGEEAATLIDARQGQLYFARHRRLEHEVEVVHPACVITPAELAALLPAGIPIFADASSAEAAGLDERQRARLRPSIPSALVLLELGALRLARDGAQEAARLEPLYLRPFAASQRRR